MNSVVCCRFMACVEAIRCCALIAYEHAARPTTPPRVITNAEAATRWCLALAVCTQPAACRVISRHGTGECTLPEQVRSTFHSSSNAACLWPRHLLLMHVPAAQRQLLHLRHVPQLLPVESCRGHEGAERRLLAGVSAAQRTRQRQRCCWWGRRGHERADPSARELSIIASDARGSRAATG
jgi:hypothetical protein